MKQILIVILIVNLLIFGYNQYTNYKRFNSPGVDYVSNKKIDLNYHDKSFLLNYYQAIEDLNGFVKLQWADKSIDIRNPKNDNDKTEIALLEYTKKLGIIKYYEDKLIESSELKNQGIDNKEILVFEQKGFKVNDYNKLLNRKFLIETFKSNPEK